VTSLSLCRASGISRSVDLQINFDADRGRPRECVTSTIGSDKRGSGDARRSNGGPIEAEAKGILILANVSLALASSRRLLSMNRKFICSASSLTSENARE